MEVDDKEEGEAGTDKTFINRILGEMKNQFNKTEKRKLSSSSNDSGISNNREGNTNCNSLDSSSTIKSVPKMECNSSDEPENNSEQSSTKVSIKQEKDTDEQPTIKEEMSTQDQEDEKPRIVLTFRKPANNTLKAAKSKNEDGNPEPTRRTLRAKMQIVDDNIILKRSSRRRSRDCNESVLQSAIARKEKSYNEASKPQRLTRQLKATPKILENLANAAALKMEKTRVDKHKSVKTPEKHKLNDSDTEGVNADESVQSDSEDNERNYRKHKHRHTKNLKHNAKRLRNAIQDSIKDSDSDQSTQEGKDLDLKQKNGKNRNSAEEKACRRSHRLSSKVKDEFINVDDSSELLEPNTAEQNSFYPDDPECSSVEAQLIASRLCLCTHKTQLYVSSANDDLVYCTAVDNVGDKLVGCNSIVDGSEVTMLRPSSRVPYIFLCEVHLNRMLRHNCCPKCGLFCTQGRFAQCKAKHQYHRDCQLIVGDSECCPHCGLPTPDYDVMITLHSSRKPIFLPTQKASFPAAKMSFTRSKTKTNDNLNQPRPSSPIIPASYIDQNLQNCIDDEKYDTDVLLQAVKEGDSEKLSIILASPNVPLNASIEELEGGTVLHYAAQNGMLPIVHLLIMAGAELDRFDKEQNTPLVCAILSFKNNVIKYLIKAGASVTLKGTDGMTVLHLAAKCGNLTACELLLDAAASVRNYVNVIDDGGWTALVWACEHGHFEIAKFLLYKGADPLLRDVEQNIALHWAAFSGSAEIAELLLNNKSDVNALNAHGDSPLHIGARQEMYNCILILLARGANVNLKNKTGETPLDCTQPLGNCHTAISLNVHLQQLTSSKGKPTRIVLTNDISNGRETNPIQCVNTIDNEQKPTDFIYISVNCTSSDEVKIDRKITTMHTCNCEEKCLSFNCLCCNNSLQCWYDEEGKLLAHFNYADPPMIFECNQMCKCNSITCNNRVVQHGITQRFQLFKTEFKGWGIRTLRNIPKGTYVCEYVGEIISDLEADRREDDSYLFDLDNRVRMVFKDTDSYCIDAKGYGNFARFINHSCEPNLVPIRVFIEHQDLRFPRIALFASRDIDAEEELSFDYGEKFWIIKYKSFTCDCGSNNCKYSEETIVTTIENYNRRLQEEIIIN